MSLFKPHCFLPKEQIESKANEVLMQMQKEGWSYKWPFDACKVADFLEIRLVWDSISPDNDGIIAAKIEPLKRLITINECCPQLKNNNGYQQSTIAHEIGHWVLHVNQDEADGFVKQLTLFCEASEQLFLCRNTSDKISKSNSKTHDESREWQAQYFAGCLLMPKYILEEKRKRFNLTKWPHLYAMRDELGVTISNLTNRLQDIGWINIPEGSKQIYLGNSETNGQKSLFD